MSTEELIVAEDWVRGALLKAFSRSISEHMQESVQAYILEGRPMGNFLQAVFGSDFVQAFASADNQNQVAMFAWASLLWNAAPPDCWGSREKVEAWIESGGLEGQRKTEQETPDAKTT